MAAVKPVILCIDDQAVILLAMKQELRRRFGESYAIETALGAEEATAVIDDTEADGGSVVLVICDWFMPGQRGDQADVAAIQRAREETGFYACVPKPWRTEILAKAITDCLSGIAESRD
jgi:CheY-like chemotaxis protein